MAGRWKDDSILPGFGLSMGYTLLYLSLIVLFPLAGVLLRSLELSWREFWEIVTSPRVVAAYRVSIGSALFAAMANVCIGLLVAWVLVRYRFFGKRFVDGLIDLPFALPTAVAGISLTTIYAKTGIVGGILDSLGIKAAFSQLGIVIALVFIGLPFVVRTVQPVLQELDPEVEEAAASLGAGRWRIFSRVIFPELVPALLTGFALAFARGIGEYGSVVFISGNMPMKTEIAPLLIMIRLEQYDYAGATAIALVMMLLSFVMLLLINLLQWKFSRRFQV